MFGSILANKNVFNYSLSIPVKELEALFAGAKLFVFPSCWTQHSYPGYQTSCHNFLRALHLGFSETQRKCKQKIIFFNSKCHR